MYACCTKAVSVLTYVETELLPHIGEPCYDLCDDTITAWRLLAFSQAQARRFVGGGRRRLPCCACAIGDAGCGGVIVAAFLVVLVCGKCERASVAPCPLHPPLLTLSGLFFVTWRRRLRFGAR